MVAQLGGGVDESVAGERHRGHSRPPTIHDCHHIRCIAPAGRVKRPAGPLARLAQAQRCFVCLGARALTLAPTVAFAKTQATR